MYSSTLSLTTALDGVCGQRHSPAALPPGMTLYLSYRRLGGPQGRSRRARKISPPSIFDPRTVQPIAFANVKSGFDSYATFFSKATWSDCGKE
jgi:hypothetical protein